MVNNLQLWAGSGWNLQKMRVPQNWETTSNKVSTVSSYGFLRAAQNLNCRGQHITTDGWRTNDSSSSWGSCYSEKSRFDMRKFNVHTWFETKFFRLNAKHIIFWTTSYRTDISISIVSFVTADTWSVHPQLFSWMCTSIRNAQSEAVQGMNTYSVYTNSTEFLSFGDGLVMFSG